MKNLQILILLFISHFSFAQTDFCVTNPLSKEDVKKIEQLANTFQDISSSGNTYVPVKLHLTNRNGVSNYYDFPQFIYEFARLNEKFYSLVFPFYLADYIIYIDNYILDELDGGYNYNDSLALLAYNKNDAINLYYVNYSNVGGRSNFPSGDKFYNWLSVRNGNFQLGETLIHEMGHYFNLYHTFETFSVVELVNGSNCSTAGDYVCDTPADTYPNVYDKISSTYIWTAKDANGQLYSPNRINYMSYYSGGCSTEFTVGQSTRAVHAVRLNLIVSAGHQYSFTYPSNDSLTISNVRAFELNSQLKVRWFESSSAIGFLIERGTSPSSGFVSIGGVGGYTRAFSDPNYMAGQTPYYRIKAANSKTNYSIVATSIPAKNGYSIGSVYSDGSFKLRRMKMYDANNVTRLYITTNTYTDEIKDYANNLRAMDVEQKYRFKWEAWGNYTDSYKVWIDLNKNQVFENTEMVALGHGSYASDSLFLDSSIKTGAYKKRFRSNWSNYSFGAYDRQLYSNVYDCLLFIRGACAGALEMTDYLYGNVVSGESMSTVDYTLTFQDPFEVPPSTQSAPNVTLNPGFIADGFNTFIADTNGCA